MANKDVQDIVEEYLKTNGFDGLVSPSDECGCLLDGLAPCGEIRADCVAGYKHKCDEDCSHEYSEGPDAWHIAEEKPFKV